MDAPRRFLNHEHTGLIEVANRGLDVTAALITAVIINFSLPIHAADRHDWMLLVLMNILISMLAFQQSELYRSWRGRPYSDQFSRLLLAWLITSAGTALIWRSMGFDSIIDLSGLLIWFVLGLMVTAGQRALFHVSIRAFRKRGLNQKSVIIYGAGGLGRSIANQSQRSPESGFRIVAFIDDNPALHGTQIQDVPVHGESALLDQALTQYAPDELWIALPLSATGQMAQVLEIAERRRCSVRLFPDLLGLTLLNHSVNELLGFPIIDLNVDRMQGLNHLLKELEDKILGAVFFLLALPLIGLIAVLVRFSSEGPVLFKQRRIGWDGKPFTIYKFRTMVDHQEKDGVVTQAKRDDPRLTWIGRWLRRTSFDELPQLYNVLQGRMSLVGPRPHAVEHDHIYERQIEGYMRRNRVKPGITGWAQINDLRGEVQSLDDMVRRVKHDLFYIEHWSLWFDLRIIIATALKIFFSKKAW